MQIEAGMPVSPRRIAIFFALRRESMYFLRIVPRAKRILNRAFAAWNAEIFGLSLLILETGVGRANARRAFDWMEREIVKDSPLDLVLCAGFGGALDPSLRVGDVIQPNRVVDENHQEWALVATLEQASRLLTCEQMIGSPAEKSSLAERYHAQVVDMESAEIARSCAEKRLPLVCFRAISDDAQTELSPHLIPLLSVGTVSPMRLACAVLRRPSLFPQLLRLERTTRRAGRNLADSLRQYLQYLCPP